MKNVREIYDIIDYYDYRLWLAKSTQIQHFKLFDEYIDLQRDLCRVAIDMILRGEY
ncbi:MAG: hypothetical protein IKT42_04195 [Clostridia bacterium]|nr:hypothetical protein [Clostridia bacterium]